MSPFCAILALDFGLFFMTGCTGVGGIEKAGAIFFFTIKSAYEAKFIFNSINHENFCETNFYGRRRGNNHAFAPAWLPVIPQQILQNINAVLASKDHNAFVAVQDDKVVGWIGMARAVLIETLPFCEINGLVIDENFRRKGIGKLLIEKTKQWAREKGNDTIRLRCNIKRTEAHLFYEHLGFKATKQQTAYEINLAN